MTIEEATNVTIEDAIKCFEHTVFPQDFSPSTLRAEAINELVLAALRAQQQENKPLTLEELREMDGEPVWIDFPTLPNWEPKCKVMLHYNDSLKYISWSDFSNSGTNGYGKVWLAYRRKPEVQE